MESAPGHTAESQSGARFPALDPEPPPEPWPQRLRWPAAAVALAAVAWAGFAFWPSAGQGERTGGGTSPAHASSTAGRSGVTAGGRVLAETSQGGLVLAHPDGTHLARLPDLGTMRPGRLPAASPGGRYLATQAGSLITLTGAKPVLARTGLAAKATIMPVPVSPFTDHDRALVLRDSRFGTSARPTAVVPVSGGAAVSLGSWDSAAGDPKARGAFVVEAVPPGALPSGTFQQIPDRRLELLDVGHKPVVLATARRLNKILGQHPGQLDTISAFPSPSGNEIAVAVRAVSRSQQATPVSGIVVLSRRGKVLDSVPPEVGAMSDPVWSHSGRALAFVTSSTVGPALDVWQIGGANQVRDFPYDGAAYRLCVWSPDGSVILCSDQHGRHWALAPVAGGWMTAVAGRGVPVTWLP